MQLEHFLVEEGSPLPENLIDFFTIASQGNATIFGDLGSSNSMQFWLL